MAAVGATELLIILLIFLLLFDSRKLPELAKEDKIRMLVCKR